MDKAVAIQTTRISGSSGVVVESALKINRRQVLCCQSDLFDLHYNLLFHSFPFRIFGSSKRDLSAQIWSFQSQVYWTNYYENKTMMLMWYCRFVPVVLSVLSKFTINRRTLSNNQRELSQFIVKFVRENSTTWKKQRNYQQLNRRVWINSLLVNRYNGFV